ncbi:MAG TPA: hypothetical protein DEW46_16320 [Verrucomicrobia bacterium]|nr:hypothetical protein [Verrucomicrobiota bacterium]
MPFRKLIRRFYLGPTDLGPHYLQGPNRRYKSPTLMAGIWIYAFCARHFSLYGFMTLAFLGVAMPYALISTAMPLYRMTFAIWTMFLWDFLAGVFFRPKLQLQRHLPPRTGAGNLFTIHYDVQNRRGRPVFNLLVDSLPKPNPLTIEHHGNQISEIPAHGAARLTLTIRAPRRGRFTFPAVRAVSRFPFGLWTWGHSQGTGDSIVVVPQFTPLTYVNLPFGLRYQHEGPAFTNQNGGSLEFLGCRPFRDGDNPRQLHMRSWARLGYPVVKEFREEYLCRTGVVLDTFMPRLAFEELRFRETGRPEFEAAVSLTAALVDYFARNDNIVDLFAAGRQVYHFQGGHGAEFHDQVLEILACLRHSHRDELPELSKALEPFLPQSNGIAMVFTQWNPGRRKLLEELHAAGVRYRAILVTNHKLRGAHEIPSEVVQVGMEDIQAGRCTAL